MKKHLLLLLASCCWLAAGAQEKDYSAEVRTQILPWVESVDKLFGLTSDGLDSLQWNETFLTECPRAEFLRMQAVVNNPAFYNYQTGYYRLHSDRGGYLFLEAANPQTQNAAARATALSSIVKIERTADGGCYLKMQGLYVRTPLKDQTVMLSTVPEKFYPVVKTPGGKVAFTNFYAPFVTRVEDGVQAFVMAENEGKAVATQELTLIPDSTPVLLRSDDKSVGMSIADDDHAVVSLNQGLRNELADLSYYYFNKAYQLYSGDGKDNYTYYRETLSTKDKLYFWQQGEHWGSVYDQTWSATGYLRMIFTDLFGMRFTPEGLTFGPDVKLLG